MGTHQKFFLVIGVYRSGTTWLQKVLESHTQVFVPQEKEIFYFSRYFERGDVWYLNHFKNKGNSLSYGEICPSYLAHSDVTAKRIKDFSPNAKLIAILRDPIEQIESMLRLHSKRNKDFDINSLNKELIFEQYLNNVKYYERLKPFFTLFPLENMLILKYDDLCRVC